MTFQALPTATVEAYRNGAVDAYGQPPERVISDGDSKPCRHCLKNVPKGAEMLILAYRPFDELHPYAETGPIFLCANACTRGGGNAELPPILRTSPDYLLKGYSPDNRIVYGTGAIVAPDDIPAYKAKVFADPLVAYIHVRSARNNCYLARSDRDESSLVP